MDENILKNNKYLRKLIKMHLNSCGICIETKTIAFYKVIYYFKKKYQINEINDCMKYFNLLIDELDYNKNIEVLDKEFSIWLKTMKNEK